MGTTFDGIQIASVPRDFDASVVGKRISELAAAKQADPWDVYFSLLIDSGGRIGALYHLMSEDDVKTGLRAPWVTIGTDSWGGRGARVLAHGQPQPRD